MHAVAGRSQSLASALRLETSCSPSTACRSRRAARPMWRWCAPRERRCCCLSARVLPVRWPLQAAVSAASFLLVLPRGANAAVGPRSWATALNVAIVFAFERSSRTHFAANRGQLRAAKGAKGE